MTATYSYLKQGLVNSLPQNPLVTHETDWVRLRDAHFLNRTLRCSPLPLQIRYCASHARHACTAAATSFSRVLVHSFRGPGLCWLAPGALACECCIW